MQVNKEDFSERFHIFIISNIKTDSTMWDMKFAKLLFYNCTYQLILIIFGMGYPGKI